MHRAVSVRALVVRIRTAAITHANDYPEGPLFSFASEVYQFGTDEDGDPITVNIVSGEDVQALQKQLATANGEKAARIAGQIRTLKRAS
jgi:hypothetical protein